MIDTGGQLRKTFSALARKLFDGIASVDDMRTFKPALAVYVYARRATGA